MQIRNKEEKNIYLKNVDFRNGLQYEYDFSNVFSDGTPKVQKPEGPPSHLGESYGVLKTRVSLSTKLVAKIKEAVSGGTEEKLESLAQREKDAIVEEQSDSGDE